MSEKLNAWIDLTFGYKLSGSSSIRAKNVCLHLVDNHLDLRDGGVVQLFSHPHPTKMAAGSIYWDKKKPPSLNVYLNTNGSNLTTMDHNDSDKGPGEQNQDDNSDDTTNKEQRLSLSEEPTMGSKTIALPKNYDPLTLLTDTESINNFMAKTSCSPMAPISVCETTEERRILTNKTLQARKMVRDMQVAGCLILEIFMPKKFLSLGRDTGLKARFGIASAILRNESHNIPSCIRPVVKTLLKYNFNIDDNDRFPVIGDECGLPPPSAHQLLVPLLSGIDFPSCFEAFARILRVHRDIDEYVAEAKRFDNLDKAKSEEADEMIAMTKVKTLADEVLPILPEVDRTLIGLIMPKILELFNDPATSIKASWMMFEPVSRALGPQVSAEQLLQPIVNIYETSNQTSKHLKLYHRTFLVNLMVRFGMRLFLKYFTENLIEAVGGYKDYGTGSTSGGGLDREWTPNEGQGQDGIGKQHKVGDEEQIETAQQDQDQVVKSTKNSIGEGSVTAKTPNEEFSEGEVFAFEDAEDEDTNNEIKSGTTASNTTLRSGSLTRGDSLVLEAEITVPSPYDLTSDVLLEALKSCSEKQGFNEGNISQVASESVIWLAHR